MIDLFFYLTHAPRWAPKCMDQSVLMVKFTFNKLFKVKCKLSLEGGGCVVVGR